MKKRNLLIVLPNELYETVRDRAYSKRISMGKLVRDAIIKYFDESSHRKTIPENHGRTPEEVEEFKVWDKDENYSRVIPCAGTTKRSKPCMNPVHINGIMSIDDYFKFKEEHGGDKPFGYCHVHMPL